MSYYTRYLITDNRPINIRTIESGLHSIDPTYRILSELNGSIGDLLHGGIVYGQIEINMPGDDIFEEDITELKEKVSTVNSPHQQQVLQVLESTKLIVAVEIGWQGLDPEELLKQIDPLWDWLVANYSGLLQVDDEGFYQGETLVLSLHP